MKVREGKTETMMKESAFQVSILASGKFRKFVIYREQQNESSGRRTERQKITSLLDEVGRKPEDLDTLFLVTHEHRDHIHGVGVLARKYKLDVYANTKNMASSG